MTGYIIFDFGKPPISMSAIIIQNGNSGSYNNGGVQDFLIQDSTANDLISWGSVLTGTLVNPNNAILCDTPEQTFDFPTDFVPKRYIKFTPINAYNNEPIIEYFEFDYEEAPNAFACPEDEICPVIVESTPYAEFLAPFYLAYPAEAVLNQNCGYEPSTQLNRKKPYHYFLGPYLNNPKGYLTIDYGKQLKITHVHIQNTHHSHWGNCATKDFKVEMSKYFINWITIIEDELKNTLYVENCGSEIIETFEVFGGSGGLFRYLRLTAETMHTGGHHAGFNFVDITYV